MDVARQTHFVNHYLAVSNIAMGTKKEPMALIARSQGGAPRIDYLERWRNNAYPATGAIHSRYLAIFRKGRLRGTGILATAYHAADRSVSLSLWLPALRKIRRMGEPAQYDAWEGSIFTYGDVYLRKPEHETHEILGRTVFTDCAERMAFNADPPAVLAYLDDACPMRGREVIHLKSTALPPDEGPDLGYAWREQWIDAHTYADYRSVYYRDGKAFKRIDKDWRSMGLDDPRAQYTVLWYGLDMTTSLEGMALLPARAVRWNLDLDANFWSERSLRKIKR